jgi:small subunit ribosomal protein S8
MVSTDPIADMLTRIRNAILVRKTEIVLPHSNKKETVAKVLKSSHYITDVRVTDASIGKTMTIVINSDTENARINEIVRLSRPGRRMYSSADEIPKIKNGRGIVVISTSKGMMTGDEAKKQRLGGELICKVY